MKLLVVEDDKKISSFIAGGLKQAGFNVDCAFDGEDGLAKALGSEYAAAVVDIMLPKLDGLRLVEEMRGRGMRVPVIILSAKRTVNDKVRGLQAGGDDYLVKPFSFSELLARVNALIRRSAGEASEPTVLKAEGVLMDLPRREVTRQGNKIELQPREFALLEYLMRNPGRPVSKTMILENIWGFDFDPQTNVVDVLVCRLRDKLDKPFKKNLIHTIRGVGYVFKNP
ncbi:MAG: response regulator transcription factor [Elusimicrobiota bacterium]